MSVTTNVIELERRVKAPPEIVFSYFVEPDKLCTWRGYEADIDPRPGGVYRVRMTPSTTMVGEVVAIDPPRRLVTTFGWESTELPTIVATMGPGSTTVEIDFIADGEDTIIRVRHSGFTLPDVAHAHEHGWKHYFERLDAIVDGGDAGPDTFTQGFERSR